MFKKDQEKKKKGKEGEAEQLTVKLKSETSKNWFDHEKCFTHSMITEGAIGDRRMLLHNALQKRRKQVSYFIAVSNKIDYEPAYENFLI